MFSRKDKDEVIANAMKDARLEMADNIREWHESYNNTQVELERSFSWNKIDKLSINVWDELENRTTYAYVELDIVPDIECFNVINHLYSFMQSVLPNQRFDILTL